MEQKELNLLRVNNWENTYEVFKQPFDWLRGILVNMTGFRHPSGYAIISPNHIVEKVWVGSRNEYPLCHEVKRIDSCIYIDNYEGPVSAIYGWKNLSRNDIEETFNFRFNDKDLDELGGFPYNLTFSY
jgi:hypothetical protein